MELLSRTIAEVPFKVLPEKESYLEKLESLDFSHPEQFPSLLLKKSKAREVYLLPSVGVLLKIFRPVTLSDSLRFLLLPHKGQLEFEAILFAQKKNVNTSNPIAFGAKYKKGILQQSYLLIEEIPGIRSFDTLFFEEYQGSTRKQRNELIEILAQAIATMHKGGILHQDFHGGNILWSEAVRKIWIIDLYNFKKLAKQNWDLSLKNLVIFNRTFQLHASRTERLRFFLKYATFYQEQSASLKTKDLRQDCLKLEKETQTSNLQFWRHREKRCLKNNKYFSRYKVKSEGYRGYGKKDPVQGTLELDWEKIAPFVKALTTPETQLPPSASWVKKGSKTTKVLKFFLGSEVYYLKQFLPKSIGYQLKNLCRTSRAFKAWFLGNSLLTRGLLTGEPILVLERREFFLLKDSLLIVKEIPSPKTLALPTEKKEREKILSELAKAVRHLHDRGFAQRDLKGPNLLSGEDGLYFLDLDGMSQTKVNHYKRCRDLGRLIYWYRFEEEPSLTPEEMDFLVESYLQHYPKEELREANFYLEEIQKYLARKAEQRRKKLK